jgi:hypothetical protein
MVITFFGSRFPWGVRLLVFAGFNNFDGNVILRDLQLPSDNPAGGINFQAVTSLNNTRYNGLFFREISANCGIGSPFSINMGTVVFGLSYQGMNLGTGTGTGVVIVSQSSFPRKT